MVTSGTEHERKHWVAEDAVLAICFEQKTCVSQLPGDPFEPRRRYITESSRALLRVSAACTTSTACLFQAFKHVLDLSVIRYGVELTARGCPASYGRLALFSAVAPPYVMFQLLSGS